MIHFAMTRPEAWKPHYYEKGSRVLGGYFTYNPQHGWDINWPFRFQVRTATRWSPRFSRKGKAA
ncbi:MAG: hypothetical protein U1E05_25825 [Patescibacteria group bacterium]|nr:hypothetical protein [Patescibacteria group bacterium]